ncbi:hypothetical protein [Fusobacterium sp. PH5-44]|uniref:hypothetical protein n=1 Tax=unclassified Fusobacterium TaxID=2648384 RepID=UPI003D1C5008
MKKILVMFLITSMTIFTPLLQAAPRGGRGGYRSHSSRRGPSRSYRGHYSSRHGWGTFAAVTGAIIIGSAIASANDNSYDRELSRRERDLNRREAELRSAERSSRRTHNAKVIYSDGKSQILELSDGTRITINQ